MIRNTDDKDMYFSYLVALRCIFDKVDVADPVRNNAILKAQTVKVSITEFYFFYINFLYECMKLVVSTFFPRKRKLRLTDTELASRKQK